MEVQKCLALLKIPIYFSGKTSLSRRFLSFLRQRNVVKQVNHATLLRSAKFKLFTERLMKQVGWMVNEVSEDRNVECFRRTKVLPIQIEFLHLLRYWANSNKRMDIANCALDFSRSLIWHDSIFHFCGFDMCDPICRPIFVWKAKLFATSSQVNDKTDTATFLFQ